MYGPINTYCAVFLVRMNVVLGWCGSYLVIECPFSYPRPLPLCGFHPEIRIRRRERKSLVFFVEWNQQQEVMAFAAMQQVSLIPQVALMIPKVLFSAIAVSSLLITVRAEETY